MLTIAFLLAMLVAVVAGPLAGAADDGWSAPAETPIYGAAISADGSLVVVGRRDNTVVAYDRSGQQRWSAAVGGTVYDVAVSADGTHVAAASEDRQVYLFDGTGQELWRYRGQQTFTSVAITADGSTIVAGGEDRRVNALDAAGTPLWQVTTPDQITEIAIYGTQRGFRVVAGRRDSRVMLLGGDGATLWETTLDYPIRGLAVTRNGSRIAVGAAAGTTGAVSNGEIALLDGATGRTLWRQATESGVGGAGIDAEGTLVVAGTRDGTLWVLDANGKRVQQVSSGGEVRDLSVTRDGTAAVLAAGNEVTLLPRQGAGFAVEQSANPLWRIATIAAIAVVLLALIGVVVGSRRRTTGERVWHGYATRPRHLAHEVWRHRISYLFLLPTVTLLLIFNYYPAISGIVHAFTVWKPGVETRWVGLQQFRTLMDDRYLWTGVGNLGILILTGVLKLLVPLAVAEMIFHLRNSRLRYLMRTLFVLQVIVPGVVGILLWVNIYDPNVGLANQLLRGIGLDHWARFWLGDGDTAIWAIVFIGFPWVSAFALLIFYGGLISIPSDLFDASAIDGASTWRRIANVDLPLLLGQIRLLLILTFIAVVQEFAAVYLTTGGGPGSATYVPSLELYYQAVRFNNFGGASAIGAVLFLVILGGTILNLRFVKSSVEYGS
jgi:ABC-type sugar transport system permease subunit